MIDIKTLTIGSHVLVGGKRVKVCGITRKKVGYHENGKPCEHLRYARLNEVEPILITPELLEEIGFFDSRTNSEIANMGLAFSELRNGEWLVEFDVTYQRLRISCIVRYLHEAEAFLALNGVELIKE